MRRLSEFFVALVLLLYCLTGQALAMGIGGYIEGASGDGEFEYEFSSKFDVDAEAGGFGFVMDSNLNGNGVFSYRLNLGFERLDLEDKFGDTLELGGLVSSHTFGFALINKSGFRWWAGPQLRAGIFTGELDSDPLTDYDLVSFGVGGVTGVNIVSGHLCISPSLGIITTGYAGETDSINSNEDFEGATTTIFVNIAVLFGN